MTFIPTNSVNVDLDPEEWASIDKVRTLLNTLTNQMCDSHLYTAECQSGYEDTTTISYQELNNMNFLLRDLASIIKIYKE